MAKYSALGAKFYFETANPPTVEVGEMGDSELDLGDRIALIDMTSHSTTGTEAKADGGLKAPPSLTGQLIYDPAGTAHESVRAAHAAHPGTQPYCKVVLPDAGNATIIFPCRISRATIGLPLRDKMVMNITVEGMGAYTFTP